MGYYINQRDCDFKIKKENFSKVVNAIQMLAGKEMINGSEDEHYAWVTKGFEKLKSVEEIFDAWRWDVNIADNGDIDGINFTGEKYGDDKILFNAIAPFVEPDSFIEMSGEEGYIWRWVFTPIGVKVVRAEIVFPD